MLGLGSLVNKSLLAKRIASLAGHNPKGRHREAEFEMACASLTGVGKL